jgi:hypothetical protein
LTTERALAGLFDGYGDLFFLFILGCWGVVVLCGLVSILFLVLYVRVEHGLGP